MIKALVFDLDNTLIDRQRAFREMLDRKFHSLFTDEEQIQQMIQDVMDWDANGTVERIVVFKKWVEKYRVTCITAEKLDADWSKESGTVAFLFDDVRNTLSILKNQYKIALLTNGNASSQRRKINTIQIDDLIDYSLVSGEFGIKKPDKRIFEYTCQQLGCNCEECAYIGDNYNIDVLGSRNAGMLSIYVSRNHEEHEDVQTIHEIKELLKIF